MDFDLMFVVPMPEGVELADESTSQVQIAKTGSFYDPRYGKFSITTRDFAKWIDNFRRLSIADGREGIPIDVDHSPTKTGSTQAVGWIKNLVQKGKELWAEVEWNSVGRELVADRQYAYLSPDYAHDYADEEGTKHGTMLKGVALTNRPFLRMATVNLSADTIDAIDADGRPARLGPTAKVIATIELEDRTRSHSSDTPRQMPILEDIKAKLKLPEDADDATVLAAINEPAKPDDRTLEQRAAEDGKVLLNQADFVTMQANATAGAEAAKELRESKFTRAFDKALDDGKVVPAQKELYEGLYGNDADGTLKLMESLQPVVNVEARGSASAGRNAPSAGDYKLEDSEGAPGEDRVALDSRTREIASEKGISYDQALALASQEVNA